RHQVYDFEHLDKPPVRSFRRAQSMPRNRKQKNQLSCGQNRCRKTCARAPFLGMRKNTGLYWQP
ncbi:MAG TPA: hypothetical protein VNL14_18040, partial [Candidatus Acidoferrales bacterium]|nr:hypothetical protein [Candidatus Acidoferrales bacterium]